MTNTKTTLKTIKIRDLSRWYGPYPGLQKLDLQIEPGTRLGVIGPNGAGKTTLLRMIAGQIPPSTGDIQYGHQNIRTSKRFSSSVGFAGHATMVYDELNPIENLQFFSNLYDLEDQQDRWKSLLQKMKLWTRRNTRVSSFSKGMKKKLSICRALIHNPDILILDEPFYGLDQQSQAIIHNTIQEFTSRNTILIVASHSLPKINELCTESLMLVNSKPVFTQDIEDFSVNEFTKLYQETIQS